MDAVEKEKCLTVGKLRTHLAECGLILTVPDNMEHMPVVIRGEESDFAVAAVWKENDRLVVDLGGVVLS